MTPNDTTQDGTDTQPAESSQTLVDELQTLREELDTLRSENAQLRNRVQTLEEDRDQLQDRVTELEQERNQLQDRVNGLEATLEEYDVEDHAHRLDALSRRTDANLDRISELQARELEKGAHLQADNVEPTNIEVADGHLERITKDDNRAYYRLPGEEDALARGGTVTHSTADLLPIQRLARYDDEMLASVTNRKPDELAAKAWRERDNPGRYQLWTSGSSGWRVYLKSSDLADWIMTHESGVSKNYAQELARRTLDAMIELSNHRLVKTQKRRTADGLTYKENVVVLKDDVDLPGESNLSNIDGPATDEVAG